METSPKVGNVGQRVAKEVAKLRGRVSVRELSARLKALGRPILPSGITKIEQGQRRVDVDDLVALALALDVSPNRLLFGVAPNPEVGPQEDAPWERQSDGIYLLLTSDLAVEAWEVWQWALGEVPLFGLWKYLEGAGVSPPVTQAEARYKASLFREENRLPPVENHGLSASHAEIADDIRAVVGDAIDAGMTPEQVVEQVNHSMSTRRRNAEDRKDTERRYKRTERLYGYLTKGPQRRED